MITYKRILAVILCWVITINVFVGTLIMLPYWIITGKCYYDNIHFKNINNWYLNLIEN